MYHYLFQWIIGSLGDPYLLVKKGDVVEDVVIAKYFSE